MKKPEYRCRTVKGGWRSTSLCDAEPPAAFIRRHRMLTAGELVSRTLPQPLPVASIAARCGFRDVGTFVRAFRRHYGCSPTEYRRLTIPA